MFWEKHIRIFGEAYSRPQKKHIDLQRSNMLLFGEQYASLLSCNTLGVSRQGVEAALDQGGQAVQRAGGARRAGEAG